MAFTLENDDSGFEGMTGLPARPDYDFFRDKKGAKYFVGGRIDAVESPGTLEEQMQFLQGGNAYVWKRFVSKGSEAEKSDFPFRIHWAIVNGEVHWYRFSTNESGGRTVDGS